MPKRLITRSAAPALARAAAMAAALVTLPGRPRAKWLVLAGWLGALAVLGPLAGSLSDLQRNDAAAYAPHDAESTRVREHLARVREDSPLPAFVVYARRGGLTATDRRAIEADRAVIAATAPGTVGAATGSADGSAVLVPVALDGADTDRAYDATVGIREVVRAGLPPGLEGRVTGPAGAMVDGARAFLSMETTSLLVTLGVVALLLLLVYRSPLLWLLPLLAVVIAAGVAQGTVYLLVRSLDLTISGLGQGVLTALVFGAGTDYALLLTARYREELCRHTDRHAAMRVALRRGVPVLAASAATVVAGLLCLLPATMNTNRALGPVGSAGVAVTLLVMVSAFPALLVACGRWIFWPRVPRPEAGAVARAGGAPEVVIPGGGAPRGAVRDAVRSRRGLWHRVAGAIDRRPRATWLLTALLLAVLACGLFTARAGVPQDRVLTGRPDSVAGQDLLARHFPGGSAVPVDVLVAPGAEPAVRAAVTATDGVARVLPAARAGEYAHLRALPADPPGGPEAEATVTRLRAALREVPGARALVGGFTATSVDAAAANARDREVVIPAVLLVVLLVLVLLLRAVVAPLLMLGTVVLSFAAALGAGWLVFDRLLGYPALDDQAVLLGFVFLVALGVDYNIFLVGRAREEVARYGHRAGVLSAVVATGGVITSAGVVLAAAFTVLALIPVILAVELGVVVAVGVLLDTFLVRSLVAPALLVDVGPRSWWPGRPYPPRPRRQGS